MDITVSRSITLNTGNFSTIKPSVSLTVKDIDDANISDSYNKISSVLDTLLSLEIIECFDIISDTNKLGIKKYVEEISLKKDEMLKYLNDVIGSGIK